MMSSVYSPGDRVAFLVPGSTIYVRAALAACCRGVVPVPLDPALTDRERADRLQYVDPATVVLDEEALAELLTALEAMRGSEVPLVRPMHLTSGTTGAPKGVWSGILSPESARALTDEERAQWGFRRDDVHLVLSPLHHSAPLRFAMNTLLAGGRLAVPGPFDTARVTEAIARDRPTSMFCVPTHLQRLFAHWDEVGVPDLSSFRLVAHAGAPCPPAVKRRLVELFPPGSTWEFYGATEGQFTVCRSEEWLQRPGTVGRARPGRRIEVEDDGTIWCHVPEHARFTYWAAPEKTARAWRTVDGGRTFTVGDLGRVDDDGYLYLEGRREDLVITGGVNVYPAEVENALAEHPDVVEAAVFGVEDDRWGQRLCAAVVGSASPEALTSFAAGRLTPAKRPKEYFMLAELPHTTTGKVKRLDLPGLLGLT